MRWLSTLSFEIETAQCAQQTTDLEKRRSLELLRRLLELREASKAQGLDCRTTKVAQGTASLDQHTKLGLLDTKELA